MTLHGVMAVILRSFTEFGSSGANYVKVVEDRPILSATKMQCKEFLAVMIYGDIRRDYQERVH